MLSLAEKSQPVGLTPICLQLIAESCALSPVGRRDVVLCELYHLCLCERQDRVSKEAVCSHQQLPAGTSGVQVGFFFTLRSWETSYMWHGHMPSSEHTVQICWYFQVPE